MRAEEDAERYDLLGWTIGSYTRAAYASVHNSRNKYPKKPAMQTKRDRPAPGSKEAAAQFRAYANAYNGQQQKKRAKQEQKRR